MTKEFDPKKYSSTGQTTERFRVNRGVQLWVVGAEGSPTFAALDKGAVADVLINYGDDIQTAETIGSLARAPGAHDIPYIEWVDKKTTPATYPPKPEQQSADEEGGGKVTYEEASGWSIYDLRSYGARYNANGRSKDEILREIANAGGFAPAE